MSQFDQTTEKKAEEYVDSFPKSETPAYRWRQRAAFKEARNSTKASMEILARAVEKASRYSTDSGVCRVLVEAMHQVKANGDWPLEEK